MIALKPKEEQPHTAGSAQTSLLQGGDEPQALVLAEGDQALVPIYVSTPAMAAVGWIKGVFDHQGIGPALEAHRSIIERAARRKWRPGDTRVDLEEADVRAALHDTGREN